VARAEHALDGGEALERFRRMLEAQGGDPHVVDDPRAILPSAPVVVPIVAAGAGTLGGVDAEAIGTASVALGAGRIRKGGPIDPAVGLVVRCKIGDRLESGQSIGEVHAGPPTTPTKRLDGCWRRSPDGRRGLPPALIHRWIESTS
jgi:thymidine phosphorylase